MKYSRLAMQVSLVLCSGNALGEAVERIEVTGSHISRTQVETAAPLTVINKEQILQSGIVNVENLLQELSVSAGPAGNATNAYWTSNGYATAQVNLRGLGIKRTLVLVNGKRMVNGGTGANSSVDLNMIPVSSIARIEVLKDGASAIYGADAIAGVVNIITDKPIDGIEFSSRVGTSSKGDGDERQVSLSLGTVSDKLSASVNLSYVDTAAVMQSDRYACPVTEVETGNSSTLECIGSSSTIGGRAHFSDGREIQFNQMVGGNGNEFTDYNSEQHSFNWFEYLNAVSPSERFNVSARFDYELSDAVNVYSDVFYSKRHSRQIVTPRGIRPNEVDADFIYNPTWQDLTLKRRRMIELGAPYFYQQVKSTQLTLGLDGTLENGWFYDVSVNYGRNTAYDGWTHDIDQQRVAQTLDMSQCSVNVDSAIPCGDYFGVGELSESVLDYISYQREGTGGNQMQQLSASISGDILSFDAGPLAFAGGVEYRKEKGWRDPDPVVLAAGAEDVIYGELDVNEAFIEFNLPLFDESVKLSTAARFSDYSTFSGHSTYKLGLTWRANDQWMFRMVNSSAMRTPSIPELFGGTNQENLPTVDPCENPQIAQIRANCLADGVPEGFVQDGSTVLTGVGGNPEVKPEKADTQIVGLVYESALLEGLSMTFDYFNIEIDNAIGSVDGSNQLRLCYTDPQLYQMYCDGFTRNTTTHQIESLQRKPLNAALENVSGWDLNLQYQTRINGLNARVSFDGTRLLEHENRAFADAQTEVLVGKITADRGSFAKYKGHFSASVGTDVWQTSWSMRYIGKADDENGGGPIGKAVPSIVYNDLQARWQVSSQWRISLGVDNLFDKKAPFLTSWNDANTDVFTYDLIGRRYFLQLGWKL